MLSVFSVGISVRCWLIFGVRVSMWMGVIVCRWCMFCSVVLIIRGGCVLSCLVLMKGFFRCMFRICVMFGVCVLIVLVRFCSVCMMLFLCVVMVVFSIVVVLWWVCVCVMV